MASKYSVSLKKIIDVHSFSVLYTPCDTSEIMISMQEVIRPGLILSGYDDYFDPGRIQFLGLTEIEYMHGMDDKLRAERIEFYLSHKPVVCIATRSLELPKEFLPLAEKYGVDPEKARLAGLLHDVMKNAPAAEHLDYMDNISAVELNNPKVWHQISGEGFLRKNGIIADEEILGAVRWHTTGRAKMTLLEKIVYVADFISADRKYEDVAEVRKLAETSLEQTILYTSRYTIKKLAQSDMLIHPATVECYNDMLLQLGSQKGQVK